MENDNKECSLCGAPGFRCESCPLLPYGEMSTGVRVAEEWRIDQTGATQLDISDEYQIGGGTLSHAYDRTQRHRAAWLRLRTARLVEGWSRR